jgi:hypothetical protein
MTTFFTGTQIKEKIERDLDLEDEEFITDDEMLGYINEGVREAAAEINDLYEDYLLKRAYIPLVSGTEEYALPSDIYAMKIRRIVYRSGSTVYSIDRIKDWKKFEEYALESVSQSSTRYKYFPINSVAGEPRLLFSPPAKETSSQNVTIWYFREAAILSSFTDTCDIPEFINFIIQYVKVRCYEKEVGHPNLQKAMLDLEQQRSQMQSTLAAMVPDADNEIEPDLSLYEEMS